MVKSLLVIAAVVLSADPVYADCGCGVELLTPSVHADVPRIVLESNCAPKQPNVVLEDAGGNPVPTRVTATHKGYDRSMQFVVEPKGTIKPGAYRVVFQTYERSTHALKIVGGSSVPPPAAPALQVTKQQETQFGCGPAKSVKVAVGSGGSLAYVELADSKTTQTGFVRIFDGTLSIGHGMCGGAFALARGRNYTATITLVAPEHGTTSSARSVTFTYAP